MSKLFIHIGTHKTGSTAIQWALRTGKHNLRKEKIIYVERFPATKSIITLTVLNNDLISNSRDYLLKKLKIYSRNKDYSFVMSCEGFSGNPSTGYDNSKVVAESLRKITDGIDVYIIVYLRRQDSFLESFYTQLIHQGEFLDFQDFVSRYNGSSFNWHILLNNYAMYFNKQSIIARRYEKNYLPNRNSLIEDFAGIISSHSMSQNKLSNSLNPGYSRDAVELARMCNPNLDQREKIILRNILQSISAKRPFDDYSFFKAEERERVLSGYSESNALVAKEYFNDPSGRLFATYDANSYNKEAYIGLTDEAAKVLLMHAIVRNAIREDLLTLKIVRRIENCLKILFSRVPILKKGTKYLFRKMRII